MGELSGYSALFLDFHGVVADDGGARKTARLEAFKTLAAEYDNEDFLHVPREIHEQAHREARGTEGIVGYVLRRANLLPPDAEPDHPLILRAAELQRNFYQKEARKGVDAMPGAVELVKRARAHFGPDKVAIVTGGRRGEVEAFLDRHDLEVDIIVTKDDTPPGRAKPDPWPYQLALKKVNLKDPDAVAVEDSRHGLQAACDAGIEAVGLTTKHNPDVLWQAGAIAVVKSLDEVCAALPPMADALSENLVQ